MVAMKTVSTRALNRSYLARQHLLGRAPMPVLEMIEHLVGLQAQDVLPPYVALWSRLLDFTPDRLASLLETRQAARLTLLRGTVHLVSKRDALRLRPLLQPELDKFVQGAGPRREATAGVDPGDLTAWGRERLGAAGVSMAELREAAARDWPDRDPHLIAQSAIWLVPATQVPPRGLWQRNDRPRWALTDRWLGGSFDADYAPDALVLRYLRAFGPASAADLQTWSRLTGMRDVVERLKPSLRQVRDDQGRTMLDVADAPWPDPETPAPVRYLGGFDNLWLAHKDRSRVVDKRYWPLVMTSNGVGRPSILIDGYLAARYRVVTNSSATRLEIEPFRPLTPAETHAVGAEGEAFLRFYAPGASHDLRYVPVTDA